MGAWGDFLLTLVVRFLCGAVLGAIAMFVVRFRAVMNVIAQDGFPFMTLLLWCAGGGVIAMFTTPRHMLPWTK